jgi:hypothetical protein
MTQQTPAITREQKAQRWVPVAATTLALVAYCLLHVLPLISSNGFSWRNFRNYFPFDQYSYLAIAVNIRDGNMAAVEPFTETGVNHYPRLYYIFLGLLSRLFNSDIIATWQIAGLILQLIMVAAVSWLLIRLTGKPLMGLLGFLPSIIGTFAVVSTGNWFHTLDNHAVLWGAFGVFFTLNGESAALSIAVTAICLLIGVTFPVNSSRLQFSRKLWAVVIICAAAIGVLANVQTYSFLTAVYLVVYVAGVFGILHYGTWRHIALSVVLLAVVIFAGPTISSIAGPLATLVAGVAAAIPGFSLILVRHKGPVIAAALVAALVASPTIVGTLFGLADKDDFLTYREASSSALGVPIKTGLLAAVIPILMLGLILWAGIAHRNRAWLAFSIGAGTAWTLVASNDYWGANQEPYRFWIDSFTIVTAAAVPVVCQILVNIWNARSTSVWLQGSIIRWRHVRSIPASVPDRRGLRPLLAGGACLVLLSTLGISLIDYSVFSRYVHSQGTESFHNSQGMAIEEAVLPLTEDGSPLRLSVSAEGEASKLLLGDPCINPFQLKTLTGLSTAFYNLGLAWPKNEPSIREILKQRSSGGFAQSLTKDAGIEYVLTDSSCSTDWQGQIHGTRLAETSYGGDDKIATITLWKLTS